MKIMRSNIKGADSYVNAGILPRSLSSTRDTGILDATAYIDVTSFGSTIQPSWYGDMNQERILQ